MELYYMQDSRDYVGNDVLWWAKNGNGYTTDLSRAETYTQEEAQRMHNSRHSDIPWPKSYIDGKTRPAVDVQYIKRNEALSGSNIQIHPDPEARRESIRCIVCGVFMSERHLWAGTCPKCGTDNRP